MKNKTLTNLIRISSEGPEIKDFDFNKAVTKWGSLRNRRILVNIPSVRMD